MAIQSLEQESSLCPPHARRDLDYALLETAEELSNEGRFVEALGKVFEHLLPGEAAPDFRQGPFSFTQGSSRVTAGLHGDDVVIEVPLVKLASDGKSVAALRYVLTNLAATGQLYQPRLRADEIRLEYREPLKRFHPAKVLEVLRKMPAQADENDDVMMVEFGAQPLARVPLAPLSPTDLARAEALWVAHWNDVEELLKECQRKRSVWFLNELSSYARARICFLLPLTGAVFSKLLQAASVFNDTSQDPSRRETVLAKCVKDMKATTQEALRGSLGHATYAISPVEDGTTRLLKGHLGPGRYMETVESMRNGGQSIDAALSFIGTYNYLLSLFAWPEPVYLLLTEGLTKASGKPWREAADILSEHTKLLISKVGDDDDDEDDSEEDEDDDSEEDEDDE